jgi:hypothetical protein
VNTCIKTFCCSSIDLALFNCICVFIPTTVLNGQVLFAISIMFLCRFHKARELKTFCCSSILHLVVTNKGNHLLITLCLVCSTIMVKFYEKLWLLKKITNYWHLNFLLLHIEPICTFFVTFFSATIDGRNLIFGNKLHIGTPYRGKHFLTRQIPTSCLPKSGGIISEQLAHSSSCFVIYLDCLVIAMSSGPRPVKLSSDQ